MRQLHIRLFALINTSQELEISSAMLTPILFVVILGQASSGWMESLNEGINAYNQRNYQSAMIYFSQAIKDGGPERAFYYRGLTEINLGLYANAIQDLDVALAAPGIKDDAYFYRGLAKHHIENYEAAVADLTNYAAKHPADGNTFYYLGDTYLSMGKHQSALDDFAIARANGFYEAKLFSRQGFAAFEMSKFAETVTYATEAIERGDTRAEIYRLRGQSYGRLNQPEKAVKDFRSALAINPNDNRALSGLASTLPADAPEATEAREKLAAAGIVSESADVAAGNAALLGKNLDQAIVLYGSALVKSPNSGTIYFNRAQAYLQKGDYQLALKDAEDAAKFGTTAGDAMLTQSQSLYHMGRYSDALGALNKSKSASTIDHYVYKALANIKLGKADEALPILEEGMQKYPQDGSSFLFAGALMAESKNTEAAQKFLERAVALKVDLGRAYYNLGLVFQQKGENARAIENFNLSLQHMPAAEMHKVHTALSDAYFEEKRYNLALSNADAAIRANPTHLKAMDNRGIILHASNRYDEAALQFTAILAADPSHFSALKNRAEAYIASLKWIQAEEDLIAYRKVMPSDAEAIYQLAVCATELGHFKNALDIINAAISKDPLLADAYFARGNLHFANEDFEAAAQDYERAASLNWKDVASMMNAGIAFNRLEKYSKALTWFEKASDAGLDNGQLNFGWGYSLYKLDKLNGACAKWHRAASQGTNGVEEFIKKFCK